ncbi:unnamed protein product [Notodromas monacha]|uniref:SnoaL-like domain-containing protein n=1 Tax=Notodromas monacha TaxID=399045 RepID=A0A7R9GBK4_9CRUS|nr:unnamed protein product [Notodromas monacha]CAG0916472.1 unnamed protein product [Notodromas monacha]
MHWEIERMIFVQMKLPIFLLFVVAQHFKSTEAQAPRGWFIATSTGPVCSLTYDAGTVDFTSVVQPPDSIISTWILGDERSATIVAQSKDIQARLVNSATNKKMDDLKNLFAPTFTQHSPQKLDGGDAMATYLTSFDWANGGRETVMELYEGPYTFTLSKMKMGADTFAVADLWIQGRSKFYEHWDAMRMSPGPNLSGRTLFDPVGPMKQVANDERSKNKELVVNSLNDYRNLKNPGSVKHFYAEDFIEHSMGGKDGLEPLTTAMATLKDMRNDIKAMVAEGDLVATLSSLTVTVENDFRSYVYVDVYRVKDCKLKEHWSFGERLPNADAFKNRNGPF